MDPARGGHPRWPGWTGQDPGLVLGTKDLTWQELADALWLAALRAVTEDVSAPDPGDQPEPGDARTDSAPSAQEPASAANGGQTPGDGRISRTAQRDGGSHGLGEAFLQTRLGDGKTRSAVARTVDALVGGWEPGRVPLSEAGARPARKPPLPHGAAMIRGLRPFKRTVPSRWEVELDEEATAQDAAEAGLWLPHTKPAAARWLDLIIVVDEGPSMPAWQRLIAQFVTLLEQLGAFRDVRLRFLGLQPGNTPSDGPRVVLRGRTKDSGITSDPAELRGPPGQRVILVLTDGLGAVWLTGAAHAALASWGQSASVAVIHLLPQQSWHHTAVVPRRVRLRTPGPAVPNQRFAVDIPIAWQGILDRVPDDWCVAVPVLELDKDWLAWWARLVTGEGTGWRDASVLLVGKSWANVTRFSSPQPVEEGEPVSGAAAGRRRVLDFRANASPIAFRLATRLAAAPLEPGFIATVQRDFIPESRPVHLAEILLSGLIERIGDESQPVSLDFIDGAREALLSGAARADTARVFAAAAYHYGERVPAAQGMHRALLAPDQVPDPPVTPQTLPFVRVEFAVMRALSGPYLGRARRIGRAIADIDQARTAPDTILAQPTGGASKVPVRGNEIPATLDVVSSDPSPETLDEMGVQMDEANSAPRGAVDEMPGSATATPTMEPAPAPSGPGSGGPSGASTIIPSGRDYRRQQAVPPVWGNVPPMNPNFTGREDLLAELHEQLRVSTTAAVLPHTLHGMGGVGKSQIAIEYAYRHAADYEVIWWVPAEQPGQILASLAALAQSLGLDVGTEANTAVPAVREALRSGDPYRNWLIVFDNAEDIEAVRPFFPTGGTGKILVTSRNPEWDRVARTLSVDVFRREESKDLLRRRTPDLSDIEADHLAQALGDLPLAIEQAASWRAATGMAVNEYLSLIEEKRTELLDVAPSPDYPLSVAAAWNVSLDRLAERNPAALQLLQICAFFAPEPISRGLFRGSRNVELTPELDEALRDPIKLGRAIRDINRYALARIEHRTDTIQLHRLVQAVLIGRMPQELQAKMRHGAHMLLADANPNSPGSGDQWPRYQALLPHVTVSRVIDCNDSWVRQLLSGMVEFLYAWGDHEGCLDLAREVMRTWTERFGEEDAQTLAVARWRAFVLRLLGHYGEAAALHEQLLPVYLRTVGEDDEGTLSVMLQMAHDLRIKGDFTGAKERDQLVLERSRRAFGDDDPATLFAAHELGVSLRLSGEYRAALELNMDTWQRRALVLGENSSLTLNTLNGLAIDQRECGEYLEAMARQEETYARVVHLFGPTNPFTIRCARNLAVCKRRAGDHVGARALSDETLNKFRRRYGDTYPDTLATATNLAVDLRQTGDLEASRDLDERTFARYVQTLGERHPYTLSVRANLAVTLRLLSEVDAAFEHNGVALRAFRETLGEDHPLTLTCATNHGSDHYAMQNFDEALRQDTDTLQRLRRIFGGDHPSTLACALNLALDQRAAGNTGEGDTLHSDTIGRLRAVLGTQHPATVAAAKRARADADIAPMPL